MKCTNGYFSLSGTWKTQTRPNSRVEVHRRPTKPTDAGIMMEKYILSRSYQLEQEIIENYMELESCYMSKWHLIRLNKRSMLFTIFGDNGIVLSISIISSCVRSLYFDLVVFLHFFFLCIFIYIHPVKNWDGAEETPSHRTRYILFAVCTPHPEEKRKHEQKMMTGCSGDKSTAVLQTKSQTHRPRRCLEGSHVYYTYPL